MYNLKRSSGCTVKNPVFNGFGLFFLPLVPSIGHSRNDLGISRVVRILGSTNFRQIERDSVWPESPGAFIQNETRTPNASNSNAHA